MVDADGSADPGEIPRFVHALVHGADFAKGTRFAGDGGSSDITHLRTLGNRTLTALVNFCYGTRYSDLCYGFNVFWRRHVTDLGLDATSAPPSGGRRLWGDGFEVETLIHIRITDAGLAVTEVPSFEHSRIHGVSNLHAIRDGLRVLRTIVVERHRQRRSIASANTLARLRRALRGLALRGLALPGSARRQSGRAPAVSGQVLSSRVPSVTKMPLLRLFTATRAVGTVVKWRAAGATCWWSAPACRA
jgi:hypothetical protein